MNIHLSKNKCVHCRKEIPSNQENQSCSICEPLMAQAREEWEKEQILIREEKERLVQQLEREEKELKTIQKELVKPFRKGYRIVRSLLKEKKTIYYLNGRASRIYHFKNIGDFKDKITREKQVKYPLKMNRVIYSDNINLWDKSYLEFISFHTFMTCYLIQPTLDGRNAQYKSTPSQYLNDHSYYLVLSSYTDRVNKARGTGFSYSFHWLKVFIFNSKTKECEIREIRS